MIRPRFDAAGFSRASVVLPRRVRQLENQVLAVRRERRLKPRLMLASPNLLGDQQRRLLAYRDDDEHRVSRYSMLCRVENRAERGFVFPICCPDCGGRLRFVAAILLSNTIRRILRHLGLPSDPVELAPAGAPPSSTRPGPIHRVSASEVERLCHCVASTLVAAFLPLWDANKPSKPPLFTGLSALGDHSQS
jgi:hypothetical protein